MNGNHNQLDYVYQSDFITYENCYIQNGQKPLDNEELQTCMGHLLLDLIDEGDQDVAIIPELQDFNSPKLPSITIHDYIGRILKQAQCSQECLIMALIIIDRISLKFNKIVLKSINVHRLYVTCILISAKFYDDKFYQNLYYAKVAGISSEEFNHLEQHLLFMLDFKLLIDPALYFKYRNRILVAYAENLNE